MLDIIGRAFPSKYQIISIKLILSLFIIVFEISLSQIHFLYQKTPYILYTFILGKTSSFRNLNLSNFDFRICVEIPIKAKFRKMNYICVPSFERERIGGKKKVNALKDGLLILSEIVKYFLKLKK